jgi:hypothetical protein
MNPLRKGARVVLLNRKGAWQMPLQAFADEARPATVLHISRDDGGRRLLVQFDVKRQGATPVTAHVSPLDVQPAGPL